MTNLTYYLVIILQNNRTYGMGSFPLKHMKLKEIKQVKHV